MLSQHQSPLKTDTDGFNNLKKLVDAVNQLSAHDFNRLQQQTRRDRQNFDENDLSMFKPEERCSIDMLTTRECEVLTLVASGYSRKEIGEALAISGNTAACHIASIYRKLDIRTIAEATIIAIKNKLI